MAREGSGAVALQRGNFIHDVTVINLLKLEKPVSSMNASSTNVYENITGWHSLCCASVPQTKLFLACFLTAFELFKQALNVYSSVHTC